MIKGEYGSSEIPENPGESVDIIKAIEAGKQRALSPAEEERACEAGRYAVSEALANGNTWVRVKSLQFGSITRFITKGAQHEWDKQNGGDGSGRDLQTSGMQVIGLNRIPKQDDKYFKFVERVRNLETSASGRRMILLYDVDKILKSDQFPELKDAIFESIANQTDMTWVVINAGQPRNLRGIEDDKFVDFVMTMQLGIVVDNEGTQKAEPNPVVLQNPAKPLSFDDIKPDSGNGGPIEINKKIN